MVGQRRVWEEGRQPSGAASVQTGEIPGRNSREQLWLGVLGGEEHMTGGLAKSLPVWILQDPPICQPRQVRGRKGVTAGLRSLGSEPLEVSLVAVPFLGPKRQQVKEDYHPSPVAVCT